MLKLLNHKKNSSNRRTSKESFWPIRPRPENFEMIHLLISKEWDNSYIFFLSILSLLLSVFRIRSDPYHWPGPGPGSVSGNVDLDPGTKKNRNKLAYKSTKIIKIDFFKKEITYFVSYTRIISSKLQQKKHRY